MKILYLTWGETPRKSGVYGTQVLKQISFLHKYSNQLTIKLVCAIPLINSGILRDGIGWLRDIFYIKKNIMSCSMDIIPIVAPQNFIYSSRHTFKLFHFLGCYFLKKIIKKNKPDIVHCRSYHAAWAAIECRSKYRLKYQILFDPRGLFPEEISLKKGLSWTKKNIEFWKLIENKIILRSDYIVCVSDTMTEYFKSLGAKNVETIYLGVDDSIKINQRLTDDSKILFCYVGALSEDGWHKTSELVKLFQRIIEIYNDARLLIVSNSNNFSVLKAFPVEQRHRVDIKSVKSYTEVADLIKNAHYGILSYFIPKTNHEKILSRMVLAVKTAEYTANSLPILCNMYCGGAESIIKKLN